MICAPNRRLEASDAPNPGRLCRPGAVPGRDLTLPIALRTARRINPFAGCGLRNNRQEAGSVAGRAILFNHV